MAYEKPPSNNIPFQFTSTGYTAPDFNVINFSFGLATQTANLQAAINVIGLFQETTSSELKECPTIVVGYTSTGPQIIKLPCVYAGIRDIGGAIHGNPIHADLGAFIASITGLGNIGAYIKSTTQSTKDVGGAIKGWTGEAVKDLGAFTSAVLPVDLAASLIGILFKGTADLGAILATIPPEDLPSSIFGVASIDLPAIIFPQGLIGLSVLLKIFNRGSKDLSAFINAPDTTNLGAAINSISFNNLLASIHGFDTRNLGAIITGVFGPGDIQATITGTGGFKELGIFVRGMIATQVPIDLPASLIGTYSSDITALINSISPFDLAALITATGQAVDLPATIIPRVIFVSGALQIALLEHKNLRAMVNSSCFGSDSKNLTAYIRSIEKLDLRAVVFGLHVDTSQSFKNLGMYINTETYAVEDRIPLTFFGESTNKFTQLNIRFSVTEGELYKVFDTIDVIFGKVVTANLGATITGILQSVDLGVTITPIFDFNYTNLPHNVSPRTREVVIDFTPKWRENWRRLVEIFFDFTGDDSYHYFYVSGSDKVYRVDRTRHWTIWGKSYDVVADSMIERRNTRSKFIFKMSNYSTVDEAVRDLIDRVAVYRRVDFPASITPILPPLGDLGASITPDIVYQWSKNLHVSVTGTGGFLELGASITGS